MELHAKKVDVHRRTKSLYRKTPPNLAIPGGTTDRPKSPMLVRKGSTRGTPTSTPPASTPTGTQAHNTFNHPAEHARNASRFDAAHRRNAFDVGLQRRRSSVESDTMQHRREHIDAVESAVRRAKAQSRTVSVVDGAVYIDHKFLAQVPAGARIVI